ncbi:hypothetical protein ACFO0S_01435 [Chryseomicrobium palamuruense]|uniref:Uncharacterized protein n=1 Tax=Chryseomicrobium palamuruense TaxID=682973 RepID=A0ABV8USM7_9BACL
MKLDLFAMNAALVAIHINPLATNGLLETNLYEPAWCVERRKEKAAPHNEKMS